MDRRNDGQDDHNPHDGVHNKVHGTHQCNDALDQVFHGVSHNGAQAHGGYRIQKDDGFRGSFYQRNGQQGGVVNALHDNAQLLSLHEEVRKGDIRPCGGIAQDKNSACYCCFTRAHNPNHHNVQLQHGEPLHAREVSFQLECQLVSWDGVSNTSHSSYHGSPYGVDTKTSLRDSFDYNGVHPTGTL